MSRYQNLTGQDACPYCYMGRWQPSGFVHVATRPDGMREYGPCPNCEAGDRAEKRHYPNGYWQGRPTTLPRPTVEGPPLPRRENARRMRLLMLRAGGGDCDPTVGIDIPDASHRARLIEAELARHKP
jgi:hypothetical protein